MKPTDLFDLEFIVDILEGEATEEQLERKSASYGHFGWSREVVEDVLRYVENPENHDHVRPRHDCLGSGEKNGQRC